MFGLLLGVAFANACYNPSIKNGGYVCVVGDAQGCPDGYTCIAGACQTGPAPATATTPDAATPASAVDASGTPVTHADLSTGPSQPDLLAAPADFASVSAPADLATVAPVDMASATCVANGGSCNHHQDAICCSLYCDYSTEKCITAP